MSSYDQEYAAPEDCLALLNTTAPEPLELEFLRAENYALTQLLQIHKQTAQAKSGRLRSFLRDLRAARDRERRRAGILEMVSSHASLQVILSSIADFAFSWAKTTGAAVWTADENVLTLQAGVNLPDYPDLLTHLLPARCAWFEDRVREAAALRGDQVEFVLLQDSMGRVIGMLLVFGPDDATPGASIELARLASLAIESTNLHQRLAFHARFDVLTGLPNRMFFQEKVEQAIAAADARHEKAAVLWIDLDRYKHINDTLGHTAGDDLLREVARRLSRCIPETDTLARLGEDEFTVIVSNAGSDAVVETIAARILNAICCPVNLDGREVRISASIGMSLYPDHGPEASSLIRNANLGMHHAKRSGRNRCSMFHPEFARSLKRQLEIEEQLVNALESEEFHLEYQPVIGLHGEIAGMEALLRWNNSKLGRVPPAEFIPVAEDMGLILKVGEWVARAACQDGANWIRSGCAVAQIAINVSALQLVDPGFAAMIGRALDDSGLPAHKLEIEVTETVLIGNLERAVNQIARLRAMGIQFSIDDFGTGFSSLNQLRTLPVDILKIDRSFIQDIEHTGSGSLVRGIIGLAHSLHLKVVAEGVETEAQHTALRAMGCDRNQGFHLHRPMDAEAMMSLMRSDGQVRKGIEPQ